MPKRNPLEPWFHQASGFWCKKIAGTMHYLDREYKAAKRQLASLLRERQRSGLIGDDWSQRPLTDLCDEFLDHIKICKGADSDAYRDYRYRLLRGLRIIGGQFRVADVRRHHLTKIEQALRGKDNSPTTIRDTISSIQRVFQWAVYNELIESNPVAGHKKPRARARHRIVTPEEFQALLRGSARNPAFRRVLLALRLTGCRPKEIRELTWEMVDLEQGLWIISKHKTITTQRQPRPRMIPLPDPIWKLCRSLSQGKKSPHDHVFVNMNGHPYRKDRLVHNMDRARRRAGIEAKGGEQLVLYSNRHTFGTEATGKVSDIELAELMGHTTTQMTKRYVHLNAQRLRDIRRRVSKDHR